MKKNQKYRVKSLRFRFGILLQILFIAMFFSCSTILISNNKNLSPKTVVLTFDDGPNDTYATTERLLAVLAKYSVEAYFCLIGDNIKQNPLLVKKIYLQGHVIVNHGMNDKTILFKSTSQIESGFSKWDSLTKNVVDDSFFKPTMFRPSYGLYNGALTKALFNRGLAILPVSFYVFDAEKGPLGQKKALKRTIDNIKKRNSAIIVFHDGKDSNSKLKRKIADNDKGPYNRSWIPDAVDSLISILKKDSFQFVLYDPLSNRH